MNQEMNKDSWKDPFNFFPNEDFSKTPTHRVDYFFSGGGDVSSPAIFNSDEDAIETALKNPQGFNNVRGLKVTKYINENDGDRCKLITIYHEGKID